jgi:hypothetical protein
MSTLPFVLLSLLVVVVPLSIIISFTAGTAKGIWSLNELILLKAFFGNTLPHILTSGP